MSFPWEGVDVGTSPTGTNPEGGAEEGDGAAGAAEEGDETFEFPESAGIAG